MGAEVTGNVSVASRRPSVDLGLGTLTMQWVQNHNAGLRCRERIRECGRARGVEPSTVVTVRPAVLASDAGR